MASLDSSGKSMSTTLSIVEQDTLCNRYIILLFTWKDYVTFENLL